MGGATDTPGVALVTGAGGGIGREISRRLAAAGHTLGLVDRNVDALAETVAELQTAAAPAAPAVVGVTADVAGRAAAARACADVAAALGPVETLVSAAGIYGARVPFVASDPEEWWAVVETNVRGAALCAHGVLPSMLQRGRGHIVNVSSRAAFWDDPAHSSVAYSTSKAALARFTGALAAEVAGTGVFVADLAPGLVRTNMTATRPDLSELRDDAFVPVAVVADAVIALVSGRYPELHGHFVHATDDLDALAACVRVAPHARTLGLVPTGAGDRIASVTVTAPAAVGATEPS